MPNEINEKTNLNLKIGAWATFMGVFITLVFASGIIYSDHKDLPEKIRLQETRLARIENRSREECEVIKLLQNQIVPANYRKPLNCD